MIHSKARKTKCEGELTELTKWQNGNLTRTRCKRCREHDIVFVKDLKGD